MPRTYISDLILLRDPITKRISAILDANSPAWNRCQPQSLLNERGGAVRQYGRTESRIRCLKCHTRFRGAGPHPMYCESCEPTIDYGLDFYAPHNWAARIALYNREYQLEGLLGRRD